MAKLHIFQVLLQRLDGRPPEECDAFLAAFADDAHFPRAEVRVGPVERFGFRDPQPRCVKQLEQRPVPDADGCARIGAGKQLLHVALANRARKTTVELRSDNEVGLVAADDALLVEKAVEGT